MARVFGEQGFQEPLVDLAQPAHADVFPKLVEHPDIRDGVAVGEVGKATPSSLFGQKLHELVERLHGVKTLSSWMRYSRAGLNRCHRPSVVFIK